MNASKPKPLKIAFFDAKPWEATYIKKLSDNFQIKSFTDKLTIENVNECVDADVVSVFILSDLSKKVIEKMKNIKLITTRSTGFDHIDIQYCKARKIKVASVPSYGENTVAQHAMAMILALSRRLKESVERVIEGEFSPEGLTGFDLKNKVLGVIGTGHIGQNVIKMANGFDMRVLAFDLRENDELANQLNFEYVKLDYLIAKSDIISLHVPYCKDTHHMIDRKTISKMKKGVILINTSRGGLIETDALFDALKSEHVGGCGLDVLEEEKFLNEEIELLYNDEHKKVDFKIALENHAMARFHNVIITPHNAFNSKEALQRIIKTTIENIIAFSENRDLNLVG